MGIPEQHATTIRGAGDRVVVLAHGLGGDQTQFGPMVDRLVGRGRIITFDLAGSGRCAPDAYSPRRHASVMGFADDLVQLCAALDVRGATYIGHSMSGMAGALAAAADPELFSRLVLIGASACCVDDPTTGYVGGFSREAIDEMLDAVESDFALWSAGFAPYVMRNNDRPEFAHEFTASLSRYRPELAHTVFRAAFTGDHRDVMSRVSPPTLVLQSTNDPAVPLAAARFLADTIPHAELEVLAVEGHFPHVVAPDLVIDAIDRFLDREDAT